MNIIPYGKQKITKDDINTVIEVLKSDFLTQGPHVVEFEKAFAEYVDAKYAVAVSNGTAALHLCNMALGVTKGSKVITTPITFAASANSVLYCEGGVDFVDIDPESYLMDLDKLEEKLNSLPSYTYSGVIPVDFAGYPVNVERLREIASKHGLWIIEDACHSPGGGFTDKNGTFQKCGNGNFSDLTVFSFHPVKHIATGEGGMITTNNKDLYNKLVTLRTHGIHKNPEQLEENHGGWYYEMSEMGYNYRLTDIQAALGTSQLTNADKRIARRKKIALKYFKAFNNKSFIEFQSGYIEGHAYHLYVIGVNNRKELYDYLKENNVFSQVHYIPLHTMPFYKKFGFKKGDFPNAEKYYSSCLSLPMFPSLCDEEQDFVIDLINNFYN